MAEVAPNGYSAARQVAIASQDFATPRTRFARAHLLATLGISLAVLGGCSGGGGYSGGSSGSGAYGGPGGAGGTSSSLKSAPGDSAVAKYLQRQNETWLNATDSGNAYSLVVLNKPNAGTTTFNGSGPAYSMDVTATVAKGGDMYVANFVSTNYFLLNPYVPLGKVYGTGTPYAVVNSPTPLPSTLTVGSSGTIETAFIYHDATQATADGNMSIAYSVKPNNASTILFCLETVVYGVTTQGTSDGLADGSETDCYSVSLTGDVNLVSVTMTVNGVTLNFH
jgi:hypothetical protein